MFPQKAKLKLALAIFVSVLLLLGLWAFWLEPASLTIHRELLRIPKWHRAHRNIRIAVLTDLHVGSPHAGLDKLQQVVRRTNEERPDLIVILGDLVIQNVVGGHFVAPELIAESLGGLRAPLGVVAVLGNHDWWLDGNRITSALQRSGVRVLENEAMRIEFEGQAFWIVGIADLWTRKPDIEGGLRQTDETNPVILITHNPDIFPDVPARVSLTLAGHTHGGQVNLPFIGRPIVPSDFGQRYAFGHVVEDGRHLFVSGGVGTSILPVRFRVPPEIVVLTLSGPD